MRKFVLAALTLTLFLLTGCDQQRIANLEKDNAEMKAQLAKQNAVASLGEQEKCLNSAKTFFRENYGRPDKNTMLLDFKNHFNRKQGRCYVVVEWHYGDIVTKSGGWTSLIVVYDALENQKYADFGANNYVGVAPSFENTSQVITCEVMGTKCKSIDEFNNLVMPLMND